MAKLSLRRYDVQAQVGMIVSLVSFVFMLALAGLMFSVDKGFRNVDFSQYIIVYGPARRGAVLVTGAVTLLLAAIGFGFGLSSAGQRRNDKQQLSWIGFFVGAGVLCLTLVMLYLFRFRGESPLG